MDTTALSPAETVLAAVQADPRRGARRGACDHRQHRRPEGGDRRPLGPGLRPSRAVEPDRGHVAHGCRSRCGCRPRGCHAGGSHQDQSRARRDGQRHARRGPRHDRGLDRRALGCRSSTGGDATRRDPVPHGRLRRGVARSRGCDRRPPCRERLGRAGPTARQSRIDPELPTRFHRSRSRRCPRRSNSPSSTDRRCSRPTPTTTSATSWRCEATSPTCSAPFDTAMDRYTELGAPPDRIATLMADRARTLADAGLLAEAVEAIDVAYDLVRRGLNDAEAADIALRPRRSASTPATRRAPSTRRHGRVTRIRCRDATDGAHWPNCCSCSHGSTNPTPHEQQRAADSRRTSSDSAGSTKPRPC